MEVILDLGGGIGIEFGGFVVGFIYVIFFIIVVLEFVLVIVVEFGFRRVGEFEICYVCGLFVVNIL